LEKWLTFDADSAQFSAVAGLESELLGYAALSASERPTYTPPSSVGGDEDEGVVADDDVGADGDVEMSGNDERPHDNGSADGSQSSERHNLTPGPSMLAEGMAAL
jgi:hypothetical protein